MFTFRAVQTHLLGIMCSVVCLFLVACSTEPSAQPLLEYRRSGGFVGFDDRLLVSQTGEVRVARNGTTRTYQIDSNQLATLQKLLADAKLNTLTSVSAASGSDLISYSITYQGTTVTTMDTVIPSVLEPVIQSCNRLIEQKP
jgi:hypothetical protein